MWSLYFYHLSDFFFNYTATTKIYTYGHTPSRHDALPIWQLHRRPVLRGRRGPSGEPHGAPGAGGAFLLLPRSEDPRRLSRKSVPRHRERRLKAVPLRDRKSTRLNSSH